MSNYFNLTILGVRGSVCTSGKDFVKYGGNTSCINIETPEHSIIIDAGTGIRNFKLLDKNVIHIFFSHYHWDHIQGFLFFKKLFDPNSTIHIYGPNNPKKIIEHVMVPDLFPISLNQIPATLKFHSISQDETIPLGDLVINTKKLNHPSKTLGYSFEYSNKKIAYVSDTEHFTDTMDMNVLELSQNADIVLYDSMYTLDEYKSKKGWGHSTWEVGIEIAKKANVKHFLFFHHDPEKKDTILDKLEKEAQSIYPDCSFVKEGTIYNLI